MSEPRNRNRWTHRFAALSGRRAIGLLALAAVVFVLAAASYEMRLAERYGAARSIESGDRTVQGRVIVLPGIRNTRFHLVGFAERLERQLPGFGIEIRLWGTPLLGLGNLRDIEGNRRAAQALADDIVRWREAHPGLPIYLVGYSGGGGLAALAVAALPEDVAIDRLVLVAPAISPGFDVERELGPHVGQFIVNYASLRDLQVGLGTRVFGTIDRVDSVSAGAIGFDSSFARLAEWHWTGADRAGGHRGNHLGYLGRQWQNENLLPALDPQVSRDELIACWSSQRQGE